MMTVRASCAAGRGGTARCFAVATIMAAAWSGGCASAPCGDIRARWYWVAEPAPGAVHVALLNAGAYELRLSQIMLNPAGPRASGVGRPLAEPWPLLLASGELRVMRVPDELPTLQRCFLPVRIGLTCGDDRRQWLVPDGLLPSGLPDSWLTRCIQ